MGFAKFLDPHTKCNQKIKSFANDICVGFIVGIKRVLLPVLLSSKRKMSDQTTAL